MKTKKYYVCGNGFDTWTIDLWHNGDFELVKEFKKTVPDKPDRLDGAIRGSAQRTAYGEMRAKAVQYVRALSERDNIPIAGGGLSS